MDLYRIRMGGGGRPPHHRPMVWIERIILIPDCYFCNRSMTYGPVFNSTRPSSYAAGSVSRLQYRFNIFLAKYLGGL